MKSLILYISFLSPFVLKAQTDSVNISYSEEKVKSFEKTTLIDEYEKAFGGNRVVKSALRLNFEKNLFGSETQFAPYKMYYGEPIPQIQYEQKISLDKSLIVGIQWGRMEFMHTFNVDLEGRWYYKMKSRIKAGLQQANITGKYLSFRVETNPLRNVSDTRGIYSTTYESIFKAHSSYSLNWGVQFGNFLNYGLAIGLKQGEETPDGFFGVTDVNNKKKNTWFITSRTPLSLGLSFPRKKKLKSNHCEFLQCNYEVKQLLKLDLTNAFYIDKYLQTIVFDLGYERKLGYSPFSLNTSIIGGFTNTHVNSRYWEKDSSGFYHMPSSPTKKYYSAYSYEIKEQLRYYLGMQKKITKGVSAGNLNGVYVGLAGSYGGSASINKKSIESTTSFIAKYRRIGPLVGYQVQTNRNSFLDININYCIQSFDYLSDDDFFELTPKRVQQIINLNLKLGIAR